VASVFKPGSPSKNQSPPAGANAASAFCRATFSGRMVNSSRAANLGKEGKFVVQVMYPEKEFDLGAQFVAVYIKFIQYWGGGFRMCFS
jgi:hypothetical protein